MFMLHSVSLVRCAKTVTALGPLGPGYGEGTGAVTGVAQLTRTLKHRGAQLQAI